MNFDRTQKPESKPGLEFIPPVIEEIQLENGLKIFTSLKISFR